MQINTPRLLLIPCTLEILNKIDNVSDHDSRILSAKISVDWLKEFKKIIDIFINELETETNTAPWSVWLVIDQENNMIIGDAGFKGVPDKKGIVEIGYEIGLSSRKKGYATEAVNGLIEWAFKHKKVNKVIAECKNDNISSIRVLEKVGMKRVTSRGDMLQWELKKEKGEHLVMEEGVKKIKLLSLLGLIISFSGVLGLNYLLKAVTKLDRISMTFISQIIITGIIIGIIYIEKQRGLDFKLKYHINHKIIFQSITYTLIGLAIFPLVSLAVNFIFSEAAVGQPPGMYWGNLPYLLGLLLINAMTAISEELCFRGYAITRLTDILNNKYLAAVISIILFLLVHIPLWGIVAIPIGVLGAFWAVIFLKTNNLSLVILIHFLNNMIAYGFFQK